MVDDWLQSLTNMKGLEKLINLKTLYLYYNPALTQTQIGELHNRRLAASNPSLESP